MQLGANLVHYAVVGSFFWLVLLGTVGVLVPGAFDAIGQPTSLELGGALNNAAGTMATVLAITTVFVTGVVLDLFGSLFARREAEWFLRELRHHKAWLLTYYRRHRSYLGDDGLRLLLARLDEEPVPPLWKRLLLIGSKTDAVHRAEVAATSRLFDLMLSMSIASEVDLKARIQMWRMTRALSAALLFVGLAAAVASTGTASTTGVEWHRVAAGLSLYVVLLVMSSLLARRTFRDTARTLLASVYTSARSQSGQ